MKKSEKKKDMEKISEKGHHVIITTGRPYRMAEDFYRELELHTPMINFNGSLTHLPGKAWEHEKCLTNHEGKEKYNGKSFKRKIS